MVATEISVAAVVPTVRAVVAEVTEIGMDVVITVVKAAVVMAKADGMDMATELRLRATEKVGTVMMVALAEAIGILHTHVGKRSTRNWQRRTRDSVRLPLATRQRV
jgi:hypothetical protein